VPNVRNYTVEELRAKLDYISHGIISKYSLEDDFWYIPSILNDGVVF
jgi:hypothetical protein